MPASRSPQLILASASPRRGQLLAQIGLPFLTEPSGLEEENEVTRFACRAPGRMVEELALAKARRVAERRGPGENAVVIGADTVVVLDGEILGKPAGPADARQMLKRLSGRQHEVYTGVALVRAGTGRESAAQLVTHRRTRVWMRALRPEWIDRYVATGEPLDKAGAYAVQGLGSVWIHRIDGCYFNVVGLPLSDLAGLLSRWGISVPNFW